MSKKRRSKHSAKGPEHITTQNSEPKSLRDLIFILSWLESATGNLPRPTIDKQEQALVFELLLRMVEEESILLTQEAKQGNRVALDCLLHLAVVGCRAIQNLSLSDPDLVIPFAEVSPLWPVMSGRQTLVKSATQELFEKIKLGEKYKSPIDLNKFFDRITQPRLILGVLVPLMEQVRQRALALQYLKELSDIEGQDRVNAVCAFDNIPNPNSPPEVIFSYFRELVDEKNTFERMQAVLGFNEPSINRDVLKNFIEGACKLPELTQTNEVVQTWMNVIKCLVEGIHKGHPELNPELRKLGISRQKHTETAKLGSDTSESNIRDGIFLSLGQTLRNMAADNSSSPPPSPLAVQ